MALSRLRLRFAGGVRTGHDPLAPAARSRDGRSPVLHRARTVVERCAIGAWISTQPQSKSKVSESPRNSVALLCEMLHYTLMARSRKRAAKRPTIGRRRYVPGGPKWPFPDQRQIVSAVRAQAARAPVGLSDITASRGFDAWFRSIDDPFAELYVEVDPFARAKAGRDIADGPVFVEVDNDSASELHRLAPSAVIRFQSAQTDALEQLARAVEGLDPLPLLCGMIFLARFESWGTYFEPSQVVRDLDLELVAGIVATLSYETRRVTTVHDWVNVATLAELVRNWAQALWLASGFIGKQDSDAGVRREMLGRWLSMRGSAYPVHGESLARALARGRETVLRESVGFTIEDVLRFSASLYGQWQRNLTPALNVAWDHAKKMTGESPNELRRGSDRFRAEWYNATLNVLPIVLGVPLNRGGSPPFGTDRDTFMAMLDELGMRPGDATAFKSVLVDPPQRTRPFLVLPAPLGTDGPEVALLAHPAALSTDLHLTVESLLGRLLPTWPKARARVVDNHAISLLTRILVGATTFTNVFIDGSAGREEIDGIVVYEDIVIVVEGKGAPMKLAARRGSVKKFVAQLRELVSEGNRQLERDARYVLDGNPARYYGPDGRTVLTVDGNSVRRCYRLLPTLDGLGDIGVRTARLVDLAILPEGVHPWIVGITDLNVVADVLRRPAEFVGYMEFRQRWADGARLLVVDELDMLALYLYQVDLAGRLGQAPADGQLMHPSGQYLFDTWYDGQSGMGPIGPPLRIKTTVRLRRFVDELQRTKPDHWLASATAALQVPITVATAVDVLEARIARQARRDGVVVRNDQDHAVVAVANDIPWTDVLTGHLVEVIDRAPVSLLLRQHGNRLRLEDVRLEK